MRRLHVSGLTLAAGREAQKMYCRPKCRAVFAKLIPPTCSQDKFAKRLPLLPLVAQEG